MISTSIFNRLVQQASIGLKFVLPDEVAGWCCPELGSLLNNSLSSIPNAKYLELGTFCGRSLIYALRNNPQVLATVIDPLPDTMIVGQSTVWKEWNKNVDAYGIKNQITLHRERIEDFAGSISGIDVALIDGNHDSGHTYEALKKCEKYLAHDAIIVVDDYNIYGGGMQTPYPGHAIDCKCPVRTDVHRYISERASNVEVIGSTNWLPNGHIYLRFRP